MRNYSSLSGDWQFQLDPDGSLGPDSLDPDRTITVPMPWQAAFPELASYSGYAWYRRSFEVPEDWPGGEVLLRFGAVDYWCRVFVNGETAGEHEGGYTPFELPVSKLLRPGDNELVVQVYDPAQADIDVARWPSPAAKPERGGPPFNAQDIPHGKQEWYINVGGIWQDVELVAVPRTYVDNVHVTPDIHSGQVHVRVELGGAPVEAGGGLLTLRIAAGGAEAGRASIELVQGQAVYEAELRVEEHRLWSPEDPYLYTLS